MKSVNIKLNTIEDVRDFVNIISMSDLDADLSSGRYVVDAKWIMGIFSLDLLSPVKLTLRTDDCDQLLKSLSRFIVE